MILMRSGEPRLTRVFCLCVFGCGVAQELRATNETLRTLQMQLEKAIHTPSPSSSTYKAIMETKDARISNLEREVALLERELQRRALPLPLRATSLTGDSALSGSAAALLLGSPATAATAAAALMAAVPPPPAPASLPGLQLAPPLPPPLPTIPPLPSLPLSLPQPFTVLTPVPMSHKHDTSFKRQVSFLLNNVQVRKDGKVTVIM